MTDLKNFYNVANEALRWRSELALSNAEGVTGVGVILNPLATVMPSPSPAVILNEVKDLAFWAQDKLREASYFFRLRTG